MSVSLLALKNHSANMPKIFSYHTMLKPLSILLSLLALGAVSPVGAQDPAPSPGMSAVNDPALRARAARPLPKVPVVVDRIAATVNGRAVTTNELSFMLMPTAQQLAALYPRQGDEFNKQLAKAKDQVLNDLIDRELLLGFFEENGFQFPETAVDQEIERTIRENFAGNREEFLRNLAATSLTIRKFRELTKNRMIVMSMRSQKYDMDIPPTPEEIRKEYQKTKSQYRDMSKDRILFDKIFIPLGPPGSEEGDQKKQMALAELIIEEIKGGKTTFEEMAKNYSKDAYAAEGGKWPEIPRSDLSAELGTIIFESPEKQIVGPLGDPGGYTIVRVHKKTLAPAPPLDKVKIMVDDQVRRMKSAVRYDRWIKRLRESAIIKKFV